MPYQLVLGANDQATAEYASRALGKRTIRYKSESRTIEILGLPRRTKVEQIRERDLMMPQEVRQMPESKMILLIEGQRPIYGDKLRFFNTQPFKSAEAYSQSHVPDVPTIEYLPHRPVPALTSEYAQDGQRAAEQTISPLPYSPQPDEKPRPKASITASPSIPESGDGNQENTRTVNLNVKLPSTGIDKKSAIPPGNIDDRIEEVEAKLKPSAERLLKAVNEKVDASDTSPRKRKSYLDIFNATVPDPEDLGLMTSPD